MSEGMGSTTIRVISGHKQDGTPVYESLLVERTPEGTYRLLRSPGLVLGVARDDVVRFDRSRERVEVVRRGGVVAFQVHGPHAVADTLVDQVAQLGGALDGRAPQLTIFSIPVTAGFAAIEGLANGLTQRHPEVEWFYGNVYDEDGETPLNWWVPEQE
ncbi:DUF4265 domain-containing protein [Angustibacter luteus]|uniref:DUF4265 domain-containing protein n=1 Tax=Angustibacter luteus TaxID=658456 RepID=A0ABW1JCK0_9ACTN